MAAEYENSGNDEIRIYQNVWKNMRIALVCLVFAVAGYFMIFYNDDAGAKEYIAGWLGIIFFGGGALTVVGISIYNKIRNIPFLIIRRDSVEMYVQKKGEYEVMDFSEIDGFRYIRFGRLRMIAVDFYEDALKARFKDSSKIVRKMVRINMDYTGAAMNIPTDNLTMKGGDIYTILTDRLVSYKSLAAGAK